AALGAQERRRLTHPGLDAARLDAKTESGGGSIAINHRFDLEGADRHRVGPARGEEIGEPAILRAGARADDVELGAGGADRRDDPPGQALPGFRFGGISIDALVEQLRAGAV